MNKLTNDFIKHVRQAANNSDFIHHSWFIKFHLEIVEKIALKLCKKYPNANKNIVLLLVWLHDYGKIIDVKNQYKSTLSLGKIKLLEFGFEAGFVDQMMSYIKKFDKKIDLENAPIEIKIVSSADGASHLVGPFFSIFWKEHSDWSEEKLMNENKRKALIDWNQKIVLPEIRKIFSTRHKLLIESLNHTINYKSLLEGYL